MLSGGGPMEQCYAIKDRTVTGALRFILSGRLVAAPNEAQTGGRFSQKCLSDFMYRCQWL